MKKIIAAFAVSCVLVCSIIVPAFAMEWDDSFDFPCEHMDFDAGNSDYCQVMLLYLGSEHYLYCGECNQMARLSDFRDDSPHTVDYCPLCESYSAFCLDDFDLFDWTGHESLVVPAVPIDPAPDTPDVPDTPVGTSPVSAIGSVFTAAMDWVKTTASVIAHNPVLLVACVAVPLCGLGVSMFIRIKSKSKVRS